MAKAREKYEVLVEVDYPTDPDVIKRLLAGEQVPAEEQGRVTRTPAAEGEPPVIVDDIPACSAAWLLEGGIIRKVKR